MLRDARGIDNSCNQFALSGPEHAICLINGYYFFSVKINDFIIVFHQKLVVPCLQFRGKSLASLPCAGELIRAACPDLEGWELYWAHCTPMASLLHLLVCVHVTPLACPPPPLTEPLLAFSSHSAFSLHFSSFHPFWRWALWKAHVPSQGFRVAWQRLRATSATVAGYRFAPQAPQSGRTINAFTSTFGSLASKITMPVVLLLPAPAPQTPEPTREGTSPQGDEKPQNWAARPGCHCQLMHPLPLDV